MSSPPLSPSQHPHDGCKKWKRTNIRLAASQNYSSPNAAAAAASAVTDDSSSSTTMTKEGESSEAANPFAAAVDNYLHLPIILSDGSSNSDSNIHGNTDEYDEQQHSIRRRRLPQLMALDHYLATSMPQLTSSTRQLLFSSHNAASANCDGNHQVIITSSNSGRVINVLQGEMAHCTPSQADVLVSDDATTCHILGLWSRLCCSCCSNCSGAQRAINEGNKDGSVSTTILASMAHIDSPGYQECLKSAIDLHYEYHSSLQPSCCCCINKQSDDDDSQFFVIEVYIHMMGGYNDDNATSIEITEDVLRTLSNISAGYTNKSTGKDKMQQQPRMQMILQTCAVSYANDNGSGCPIGRGLALNVSSGKVYLAEVEEDVESSLPSLTSQDMNHPHAITNSAQGPDVVLRSSRVWASSFYSRRDGSKKNKKTLQVIHHHSTDYVTILPFYFRPHPYAHDLLSLNDEQLIQLTSTSPEVEKDNFVRNVRRSLSYMNGTSSRHVFKKKETASGGGGGGNDDDIMDDYSPRRFRRVGLNGWVAVA